MDKDAQYETLSKLARRDPQVLGLVLVGGRGKGFVTEDSDYDVVMVVEDAVWQDYRDRVERQYQRTGEFEVNVFSLSRFRNHANWDTPERWDRYAFTHLRAQYDPTGEIQQIINAKGKVPPDRVKETVEGHLDAYINFYHRSLKNHRDGNTTAALLDAAASVPELITVLFAIEGRMWPYNKYLEWELKTHPLRHLPWTADEFLNRVRTIVSTGDRATQVEVFEKALILFGSQGYANVLDKWKGYYLG